MWKRLGLVALLIGILPLAFGCGAGEDPVAGPYDERLAALFPEKPYTWTYTGDADYYQEASIISVRETKSEKIVEVAGEVKNDNPRLADLDFGTETHFRILQDRIVMTDHSPRSLRSPFEEKILLMTPLVAGTSWEQTVTIDGKRHTLQGTLLDVTETEEGMRYRVRHATGDQSYHEMTEMVEGEGIVSFRRRFEHDGAAYEEGYDHYKAKATHFVRRLLIGEKYTRVYAAEAVTGEGIDLVVDYNRHFADYALGRETSLEEVLTKDSPLREVFTSFDKPGSLELETLRILVDERYVNNWYITAEERWLINGSSAVDRLRYTFKPTEDGWRLHTYERVGTDEAS